MNLCRNFSGFTVTLTCDYNLFVIGMIEATHCVNIWVTKNLKKNMSLDKYVTACTLFVWASKDYLSQGIQENLYFRDKKAVIINAWASRACSQQMKLSVGHPRYNLMIFGKHCQFWG